jgi:hypothetical protein
LPLNRVRNKFGVELIQVAQERTRSHCGDRIGLQRCSLALLPSPRYYGYYYKNTLDSVFR